VHAHMRSRRKICLILIPEFRRLVSDIPVVLLVSREK
jgi:hypothetical protein